MIVSYDDNSNMHSKFTRGRPRMKTLKMVSDWGGIKKGYITVPLTYNCSQKYKLNNILSTFFLLYYIDIQLDWQITQFVENYQF